jgi:hypothetical protein
VIVFAMVLLRPAMNGISCDFALSVVGGPVLRRWIFRRVVTRLSVGPLGWRFSFLKSECVSLVHVEAWSIRGARNRYNLRPLVR